MSKFLEVWHNSKPVFKLIWSAFAAFGIVLSVLIPITSFLFPDKAEPRYMVISDELVIASPTSRITIYHDSTAVPNIRILQIALWNEGKTYLEKVKFLTPYIAEIENSDVSILQVDSEKKSRQDLKFRIKESADKSSIFIFIDGDEVLEKNDGLIIKIFYTSNTKVDWNVKSRILGIPTGFKEYSLINQVDKYQSSRIIFTFNRFFYAFLLLILWVAFIFSIIKNVNNFITNKNYNSINEIIYLIFYISIFSFMSYKSIFTIYENLSFPEFLINMGSI